MKACKGEVAVDTLKILPDTAASVKAFAAYQQHFPDVAQAQVIINNSGGGLRRTLSRITE